MKKNSNLLYFILALNSAHFWAGISMLYFLRFTNFAGIGLIEMIVTSAEFIFEIPTGVITDIIGKKKSLLISMSLSAASILGMALATTVIHLFISVFVLGLAGALASGTTDALLFDSLKQIKKQHSYHKIRSHIEILSLFTLALASILGGFMYVINPRLPFVITAITTAAAFLLCLPLTEPRTDSQKANLNEFFAIFTRGFKQLYQQNQAVRKLLLELLMIGSFIEILDMMLDGALVLHFGYKDTQLGILFAIIPILAAASVFLYERWKQKDKHLVLFARLSYIGIIASTIISPFLGFFTGGATVVFRNLFYPVISIASSNLINHKVESKHRVTTLSTFSLLRKLPYVLCAFLVGHAMDTHGSISVSFYLSLIFLTAFLGVYFFFPTSLKRKC